MPGRAHAIVMLALLLAAPAALHAQAPGATPAPSPQTPPCAVPADDNWTNQEKFVWRRVCAGEVADFNTEPGYLGDLDPQKAPLPANRTLRPSFIVTVLTQDKFANAIKQRGLRVTGARFAAPLDLGNAELRSELWFERCRFEGDVDLSWVRTAQPIAFNKSSIAGTLTFYAAQIGSNLYLQDSLIGAIVLNAARVARTLGFERSQVAGDADMGGLDVGANLEMNEVKLGDVLQMEGLHVGVNLDLHYANLQNVILIGARAQQMSFEGATVLGEVDMIGAQVGGDLLMASARFSKGLKLRSMQVGGQLNWSGTHFRGDVDLTGSRIAGALLLADTQWHGAMLTARFAKIGIIPRLTAPWPDNLEIEGLIYEGLDRPDDPHEQWFAKIRRYSRQPYEQLAHVLQTQGEIARATAAHFAEREHDRNRSNQPYSVYVWLTVLKITIGYGYYPQLALVWVGFFILLGAFVLRVSGEGAKHDMPWGFAYSFDMLIPFIRLRESHYRVEIASRWRYYFYFHRIMGWVLASFLVAGLSGLTK
jgi:hypothetical protein